MKFYRCFDLRADGCPRHIFERVLEMASGTLLSSGAITVEAAAGDDAKSNLIEEIAAFCKASGLPWSRRGLPGTFAYEINRHYEPADLTGAKFLTVERSKLIQLEDERNEQGRLLMLATKASPSRKIGRINPNWIIVSETTRKILAAGHFVGLEFREVALKGKSINASKEPFWELKSSLTLPKMANTDRFVTAGHVPFDGDYGKMVWIDDSPYRSGEIHYHERDIKNLGEFDVAKTLEKYMEPHPALVVSQRFYQHCLKHKIPLAVEPVRIDPD